jgi:hypothetical protein
LGARRAPYDIQKLEKSVPGLYDFPLFCGLAIFKSSIVARAI